MEVIEPENFFSDCGVVKTIETPFKYLLPELTTLLVLEISSTEKSKQNHYR